MRKPRKESFKSISPSPADPTQFYYKPFTSYFYWKRCELAVRFLDRLPRARRCLELACGTGVFLPELAGRCRELYAVDLGADLEGVKHLLSRESVTARLQKADICDLPFEDEFFDLVVGMSCLEHLDDPARALREAKRVLTPDGAAILGIPIETVALNLFFKAVGFDHEEGHVARYDDIVRLAKEVFPRVEVRRFPPLVPTSCGLYLVMKCTKR